MSGDRLKRGDTISVDGDLAVIVRIGRGMVRSAYVVWKKGGAKLITEIDFWHSKGVVKFVTHKRSNIKFAREYCAAHPNIPDL